MNTDPAVLAALKMALDADPSAQGVRLHLAKLLLDSDPTAAIEHYRFLLARDPGHLESLMGAAVAADKLNDHTAAATYRKQLAAQPVPPTTPVAETPKRGPVGFDTGGDRRPLQVVNPEETPDDVELERPKITLADVGGMEAVKRRIDLSFLGPLRHPELSKMYGKSLHGGLLLYGPPGCGKTFVARAIAGELGAHFISVGISDVLDMWLGNSEKQLHELFLKARRNTPTVLFFDELDALGHKRSQLRGQAGRNVVNMLLSELDGVASNNKDLFILAATNHPWDVDEALRRPGRLDRTTLVLPPDEPARVAILLYYLRDRPAQGINIEWLAQQTTHFSGADLAHLCESAVENAMSDALSTGNVRPMTMEDFKSALKGLHPSTLSWFQTAKNFALFANEGGLYDDLLAYIKQHNIG